MITDKLESIILDPHLGPSWAIEELKNVQQAIRAALDLAENDCNCDCSCDRHDDEPEMEHGPNCFQCDHCAIASILRGET